MPLLSVVIPVLNEEKNISTLIRQLHHSLSGLDYEILFVDDGSTDTTREAIKANAGSAVKLLALDKNYGQSAALRAGIEHAAGEYIAMLDGDLQNDPADIPAMLSLLEKENADVVAGNRKDRKDGLWFRKIPSRIANALIRYLTGVHIRDYGCTLRVFRRETALRLHLYGKLHRFIPVLAAMQGARIIQTNVHHHPRIHGKSKYGLSRFFTVISDIVLVAALRSRPHKKRRIVTPLGTICLLLGIVTLFNISLEEKDTLNPQRHFLQLPAVILIILGVLLITGRLLLNYRIRAHYRKAAIRPYNIAYIYPDTKNDGQNSAD